MVIQIASNTNDPRYDKYHATLDFQNGNYFIKKQQNL